jgi:hypothetical protein
MRMFEYEQQSAMRRIRPLQQRLHPPPKVGFPVKGYCSGTTVWQTLRRVWLCDT